MARQLDIVALEPFFGGVRKDTVELLAQHSRHRWSVFKLPPRRLERRLSTAAQWFHQQLARASNVRCDALFTSDAMNLADFVRLNPEIGRKAIVAYYYCNPLSGEAAGDQQARLSILSTANCATEIWFNSLFHMKEFLANAAAIYDGHPEIGGKDSLPSLISKSQVMHPPVQVVLPGKDSNVVDAERKGRTIAVDNRDGRHSAMFGQVIARIAERREPIAVHVLGRVIEAIPQGVPVIHVDPNHGGDVIRMLRRSELFISAHDHDHFEPLAIRAMALGCIPVLPKTGFYKEFLPQALHSWCLFDPMADELLNRIMDLWYLRRPAVARRELDLIFDRYTPLNATRNFDQRLHHLADSTA